MCQSSGRRAQIDGRLGIGILRAVDHDEGAGNLQAFEGVHEFPGLGFAQIQRIEDNHFILPELLGQNRAEGGLTHFLGQGEGVVPRVRSKDRSAAAHVRPGGTLVYATCTFRRAENDGVALAFEAAHPAFERAAPLLPAEVLGRDRFVRTWPHRHGTDAFFAAVWIRAGGPR